MSIVYHEDNSITLPANKVISKGMFKIQRGGEVLAELDGVFDFTDIPPEHHEHLMMLIQSRGMRLVVPEPETQEEREERQQLYASLQAWRALPWWKRLFIPNPVKP